MITKFKKLFLVGGVCILGFGFQGFSVFAMDGEHSKEVQGSLYSENTTSDKNVENYGEVINDVSLNELIEKIDKLKREYVEDIKKNVYVFFEPTLKEVKQLRDSDPEILDKFSEIYERLENLYWILRNQFCKMYSVISDIHVYLKECLMKEFKEAAPKTYEKNCVPYFLLKQPLKNPDPDFIELVDKIKSVIDDRIVKYSNIYGEQIMPMVDKFVNQKIKEFSGEECLNKFIKITELPKHLGDLENYYGLKIDFKNSFSDYEAILCKKFEEISPKMQEVLNKFIDAINEIGRDVDKAGLSCTIY